MAKDVKKDPQDLSVEEKLKALYQLQTMLSEIDKIHPFYGFSVFYIEAGYNAFC